MPLLTKHERQEVQSDIRHGNANNIRDGLLLAREEMAVKAADGWPQLRARLKRERAEQAEAGLKLNPQDFIGHAKCQGICDWIETFIASVESSADRAGVMTERLKQAKGA